jgi:hypothetical protein
MHYFNLLWRHRLYWLPGLLFFSAAIASLLVTVSGPRAILFRYVF